MKKLKPKILIWPLASVLAVSLLLVALLLFFGVIHLNNPSLTDYPVRGVDLSTYQGTVDWNALSAQDISFAFIKATEGSSLVDPKFQENWTAAVQTKLRIGAYHFFSFESSGEKQAELFCNTVDAVPGMLPPVIDVEFYGGFRSEKDIDVEAVKKELRTLVDILCAEYGMKPIIYASRAAYKTIVRNDFDDCDLWFRSVYTRVPKGVDWTFWQYSNRHVLKGYDGKERYIDMDVFAGTVEEFENYPAR